MSATAKPYEHDETAGEVIAALVRHFDDSEEFKFPPDQAKACVLGYGWWVGVLRMAVGCCPTIRSDRWLSPAEPWWESGSVSAHSSRPVRQPR